MNLREKLVPMLTYKIGRGEDCKVFGQPWFEGSINFVPSNWDDYKLVLNDLLLEEGQGWDMGALMDLFGYQGTMRVLQEVKPPNENSNSGDALLFKNTSSGQFSVKEMYKELRRVQAGNSGTGLQQDPIWEIIWKRGVVLPRIRLFLWKLVQGALPLGVNLQKRNLRGDALCCMCGKELESEVHMVFRCEFARLC